MRGIRSIKRSRLAGLVGGLFFCLQLVTGVSASERVLCVAADGHVTVELAHAGRCMQAIARHHGGHGDASAAMQTACDGHPCADVVLGRPVSQATSQGHEKIVPAAIMTVAQMLPGLRPALAGASAFGVAATPGETSLGARRTIVLLV